MARTFAHVDHGTTRLRALAPLLESIAREIEERAEALETLLVLRGRSGHACEDALEAECSAHRQGLRRARIELADLGCLLVSTNPCTFCVPVDRGPESGLVLWRILRAG